jgi:hypothetical protein
MKMQQGHALCPYLMDMLNIHAAGHAVWTRRMDRQDKNQGPMWVLLMKKTEVENLRLLSL